MSGKNTIYRTKKNATYVPHLVQARVLYREYGPDAQKRLVTSALRGSNLHEALLLLRKFVCQLSIEKLITIFHMSFMRENNAHFPILFLLLKE